MFDLSQINFAVLLFDVLKALLIAGITAFISYLIVKHYAKYVNFAKKMKRYGFEHRVDTDQIDFERVFETAAEIQMMYVSAKRFFEDEQKVACVRKAAERGAKIQFLFAKHNTDFLNDIMRIEINHAQRKLDEDINKEMDVVYRKIKEIKDAIPHAKIETRYFSTEYRSSMVLAKVETKKGTKLNGYLNLYFPPDKSDKHILLEGTYDYDKDRGKGENNIVKKMQKHFEAVWEMADASGSTAEMNEYFRQKDME